LVIFTGDDVLAHPAWSSLASCFTRYWSFRSSSGNSWSQSQCWPGFIARKISVVHERSVMRQSVQIYKKVYDALN